MRAIPNCNVKGSVVVVSNFSQASCGMNVAVFVRNAIFIGTI